MALTKLSAVDALQWGFVVSAAPAFADKVARSGAEELLGQLGPQQLSPKAPCSGGSAANRTGKVTPLPKDPQSAGAPNIQSTGR